MVERLGRFHAVLSPASTSSVPFFDRVAYKHDLREIPLDVPPQICITRDNTQLQVDGILYFQVTDPRLASYGASNYVLAITQLAQTTLRSVIGRMELDRAFEERDQINAAVVSALDAAAANWGVKVLRYEIKDLTPPAEILRSMQAQITAEREKRAVILTSEGKRQEQINLAVGAREAAIAQVRRREAGGDQQRARSRRRRSSRSPRRTRRRSARSREAIDSPGRHQRREPARSPRNTSRVRQSRQHQQHADRAGELTDIAGLVATAMSVSSSSPALPAAAVRAIRSRVTRAPARRARAVGRCRQ